MNQMNKWLGFASSPASYPLSRTVSFCYLWRVGKCETHCNFAGLELTRVPGCLAPAKILNIASGTRGF